MPVVLIECLPTILVKADACSPSTVSVLVAYPTVSFLFYPATVIDISLPLLAKVGKKFAGVLYLI